MGWILAGAVVSAVAVMLARPKRRPGIFLPPAGQNDPVSFAPRGGWIAQFNERKAR